MADYAIHEETLIAQANIIRKKFGTSDRQDPADYEKKMNLMGVLEEKVASSASICILEDGADDVQTSSVKVKIPANLNGKSAVEETQTGKNLFNYEDVEAFNANVIITRNDGDYTIQNNNSYAVGAFWGISFHLKPSSYSLSLGEALSIPIRIYKNDAWFNNGINAGNTSCTFTVTEEADYNFSCNVPANSSLTIKKCQFEINSTASEYEEYIEPKTYSANLGRTVYGAEVDIVNGEGKENCARIKISDLNWTYYTGGTNPIFYAQNIPNMKTYARGEAPNITIDGYTTRPAQTRSYLSTNMANMECSAIEEFQTIAFRNVAYTSVSDMLAVLGDEYIVYEIATPTEFTFDGQEIPTMLGYNAFMSEDGETEVTYRSSGTITKIAPALMSKTIEANGIYSAEDDGVDGYDTVAVNVPSVEPTVTPLNSPNAFLTLSGVTGTDVERTVRTETAPSNGKYVFASDSTCRTNTGSGDGFFDIRKNDVSVVKQYMAANTTTPISIPEIEVETGDEIDIIVGFDNAHSSCNFQLYTGIAFVSESSASLLSMGGGNSGSTEESEEVSENSDNEESEEER